MRRPPKIILIAGLYIGPVMAGDYSFCVQMNKDAEGGKIQEYSDQQIENGLCMTTKESIDATVNNEPLKLDVCGLASEHMMKEFMRRFPDGDAQSVVDKC